MHRDNNDDQVADVTFRIRQDIDQCDVHILGYQFYDGDWQEIYEQTDNLCDYVEKYQCIFTDLAQYGNLPSHCPYTPKDIRIEGYRPDPNCFPKDLPNMLGKADIIITCKSPDGTDVEALRGSALVRVQDAGEST